MTQQWNYGIANIKDARHITNIIKSHLIMHKKIQIIIQAYSTKVLISNHTKCTPEYGKHITHWPKGLTCSDTTKRDTLYPTHICTNNKRNKKSKLIHNHIL